MSTSAFNQPANQPSAHTQVLEEADRSLHDALCVIRCLVQKRFLIAGGAAPEMELNVALTAAAKTMTVGVGVCFGAGVVVHGKTTAFGGPNPTPPDKG